MTLRDKIKLTEGKNCWETREYPDDGVPKIFMCDGPHGLRKQDFTNQLFSSESVKATCFPTAVTTASSFDVNLLEEIGDAIAKEAIDQKSQMVLGPGVNIKRNPLCGRNFEYFSEDPYLAGKLAAGLIKGIQKNNIGACIKHFACNNQEYKRMASDSLLDERTLREIYLTAFEIAIKESKPKAVMSSYNKINGDYSSENKKLLTDILRDEWGFEGFVMSDWSAINDRVKSIQAGCDLLMPGGTGYGEKEVINAVKRGELSKNDIRRSAARIAKVARDLEVKFTPVESDGIEDYIHSHDVARKAAEQSAVLLKNDGILPLKANVKIALLGEMADNMRYQGSGSSRINPMHLVNPVDVLDGCKDIEAADVCVIFAGLPDAYEAESYDRADMKMPQSHIDLINETAAKNPNTVVVLFAGSPVEMPWIDNVKAVLYMGLPGEAGGEAVKNLLYGYVNPCGKLAETWTYNYSDVPSAESFGSRDAVYSEGIFVGYRYYSSKNVAVRFPFGYGLSYTTFEYDKPVVSGDKVTVKVKNTGSVSGYETVMMFVEPPESGEIERPVRELKGFTKIYLKPGETKTAEFTLTDRSFAIWQDGWVIPKGTYNIEVGGKKAFIFKQGDEFTPIKYEIPKPSMRLAVKGEYTLNDSVMDLMHESKIVEAFVKKREKEMAEKYGNTTSPEYMLMHESVLSAPMRAMIMAGQVKEKVANALLECANGKMTEAFFKYLEL
ncbi:MAG: glycoside hydrolase family 3 C-terminal domain-containing protein [Ruminococcus sp.]|jgi:beta-glucosidase|nr:glycoside hydrolase family 3 C-terminal domain-containing protein [Ruminococcus sp.]